MALLFMDAMWVPMAGVHRRIGGGGGSGRLCGESREWLISGMEDDLNLGSLDYKSSSTLTTIAKFLVH